MTPDVLRLLGLAARDGVAATAGLATDGAGRAGGEAAGVPLGKTIEADVAVAMGDDGAPLVAVMAGGGGVAVGAAPVLQALSAASRSRNR